MKVEQFFYVLEIADTGSFSQAARNLYISQPNLSYAVKQIEKAVGFPLFVRTPVGVVPTADGSKLIERFRIIKREYDQIEEIIQSPARNITQTTLRVGTMSLDQFASIFTDLIRRHITTPVNFSFMNYANLNQILPLVETCQLDMAIIGTLSPYLDSVIANLSNHSVEYHIINDVPVCALVGPQNPLYYGPDTVSIKDLYPHTIVSRGNIADDPELSVYHVIGLSAHCFSEIHVNSTHFFYNIIQTTPAIGIVAYVPSALHQQPDGDKLRPILLSDCEITAQFGWIKHRRLPLPEQAAELLKEVKTLF